MKKLAIGCSLIPLVATLAGCAFSKGDAKKKEQVTDVEIRHEVETNGFTINDFKIDYIPQDEIGRYQVVISWPKMLGAKFSFQKDKDNGSRSVMVPGELGEYKFMVTSGDNYKIWTQVQAFPQGIIVSDQLEIFPPVDVAYSYAQTLRRDLNLNVGRLILDQGAVFNLNGYNLNVKAKSIYVQAGAKISTYEASSIDDSHGSVGGNRANSKISIVAESAIGQLEINLVGFDGRDGKSGPAIPDDPSLNGIPGAAAVQDFQCVPSDNPSSPGTFGCSTGQVSKRLCMKAPGKGGDGKDGRPGLPGANGENGGDTGDLSLQIKDSSKFKMSLFLKPGIGGSGGLGGPGQRGGAAGAAGVRGYPKGIGGLEIPVCIEASSGRNGQDGSPGPDGKHGQPGKVGKIEMNGIDYFLLPHSVDLEGANRPIVQRENHWDSAYADPVAK